MRNLESPLLPVCVLTKYCCAPGENASSSLARHLGKLAAPAAYLSFGGGISILSNSCTLEKSYPSLSRNPTPTKNSFQKVEFFHETRILAVPVAPSTRLLPQLGAHPTHHSRRLHLRHSSTSSTFITPEPQPLLLLLLF